MISRSKCLKGKVFPRSSCVTDTQQVVTQAGKQTKKRVADETQAINRIK